MEILTNYIIPALGYLGTICATILAFVKHFGGKKAEAVIAIVAETKRLVAEAEITYKEIDAILKAKNSSAGSLKKGYVVNALKAFCLENGYAWNAEEMDAAIETEVAYTKTVNAKNA